MNASQLRALARENLQGNWVKAALLVLVFFVSTFLISFVLGFIPLIGPIISFIISPVLSFGITVSLIRLARNEETTFLGFLKTGFDSFVKVWGVNIYTIIKMILPIILIVISVVLMMFTGISIFNSALSESGAGSSILLVLLGIILYIVGLVWTIVKSFSYTLTLFILNDEPELPSKEIVNKSESLMNGNKWRFFCLSLSFIGWYILAYLLFIFVPFIGIIAAIIGFLFLIPYIEIASLKFYEELAGTQNNNPITNTDYTIE